MSTEQSAGETQVDIAQQATNPAPKPREKNPKRVAAGKLVAEKTRIAREQQKKAAAEASVIIANNNAKQQPHHLILPQLQQKKIAAPLPSPNGLWLAARSGPKPFSAKKKA